MCEPDNGFTTNLEALVAEVQAEHHGRESEDFTPSSYAGLQSAMNRQRRRVKYDGCKYVRVTGGVARQLCAREIEALQRHIAWLRGEQLPAPAVRKAVV